jgi:hypothetical protein
MPLNHPIGSRTGTTITLGLSSAPTNRASVKLLLPPEVCTLVCCSGVVTLMGLYTTTGVEVLTEMPLPGAAAVTTAGTPAAAAAAGTAAVGGTCAAFIKVLAVLGSCSTPLLLLLLLRGAKELGWAPLGVS